MLQYSPLASQVITAFHYRLCPNKNMVGCRYIISCSPNTDFIQIKSDIMSTENQRLIEALILKTTMTLW